MPCFIKKKKKRFLLFSLINYQSEVSSFIGPKQYIYIFLYALTKAV